jgi:hypothetical protein
MAFMSKEHEIKVLSLSISVKTCFTCILFRPGSNIYQFLAIMVAFDFFKLVVRLAKQISWLTTVPAKKQGRKLNIITKLHIPKI